MMKSLVCVAAATFVLSSQGAFSAELTSESREKIISGVDSYASRMTDVALQIWSMPELGYLETETSALLQSELRNAGFEIEAGVADIPTAFVARAGTNDGPVIAFLAEMDALPGMSQSATPQRAPVQNQISGHACGHHLFGSAAVAGAIAVKNWLDETGTNGQIRVYGTPAEEGGGGKVYMVRAGLFDDVDSTFYFHPSSENNASQNTNLAVKTAKFRFRGQATHAAAAPERGRSALDAVEAMNFMVNAMREHVPQDARIHYVITNGGAAPNIVPEFAESFYYVRHPDPRVVADIFERVTNAAEGAALGTGTEVDFEVINAVYSRLPNDVLGRVVDASLRTVGAPEWTAEEVAFAETLQPTLGGNLPSLADAQEIQPYEFNGQQYASTDSGDVSWVTPLATFGTATWVPGTPAHTWQATAAGGMSIGTKGAIIAAKTLALTAAQLYESPDLITAAREEFESSRGPDFVYEALAGDRAPPLGYRDNSAGSGL